VDISLRVYHIIYYALMLYKFSVSLSTQCIVYTEYRRLHTRITSGKAIKTSIVIAQDNLYLTSNLSSDTIIISGSDVGGQVKCEQITSITQKSIYIEHCVCSI
jgi:hypothetical protein